MNSEWTRLDINNLPPDIMSGKYEFISSNLDSSLALSFGIMNTLIINGDSFCHKEDQRPCEFCWYREKQKPKRTHDEIMESYWKNPPLEKREGHVFDFFAMKPLGVCVIEDRIVGYYFDMMQLTSVDRFETAEKFSIDEITETMV
jgi:hypothetical protein